MFQYCPFSIRHTSMSKKEWFSNDKISTKGHRLQMIFQNNLSARKHFRAIGLTIFESSTSACEKECLQVIPILLPG